jgi:hypothetical protein
MNAYDKHFSGGGDLAVLRYGDGDLTVLRPGKYVLCAVSGQQIPIDDLRYWNPRLQEAYAGPAEALERFKQLKA